MMRQAVARLFALSLVLFGHPASVAGAQQRVTADVQAELRLGAMVSPEPAPHAGVGVNIRAGWYSRLGISAEAGATRVAGEWRGSQRIAGTARFLLDPFGERRLGLYGGAGLGLHRVGEGPPRGVLLLLLGVEGRMRRGRLVPAFEVGLGGGVQLGLVLRPGRADSR